MTLEDLIRLAYSAERAAAFAYRGHAQSVSGEEEKAEIRKIESEEWLHRENLKRFMVRLGVRPSKWYEMKYALIGKIISWSCHITGHFMPMYFAGRLESRNVNEYLLMEALARDGQLHDELPCMREMAMAEKRHEMFFLKCAERHRAMWLFKKIFRWGPDLSLNQMMPEISST